MSLVIDLTYDQIAATQATGVGDGVLNLTTPATSGEWAKVRGDDGAVATNSADAFWLSGKIATRQTNDAFTEVGFTDSGRSNYARIIFDSSVSATNWLFQTRDGTTQNSITLADVATNDQMITVDIVYRPGDFAACWIGGAGPITSTANLPNANFTPYFLSGTNANTAKTSRIDWLTFRQLDGPISHPLTGDLVS